MKGKITENIFNTVMAENFTDLKMWNSVTRSFRTPNRWGQNRTFPHHIVTH
jgi:hypothetical protein